VTNEAKALAIEQPAVQPPGIIATWIITLSDPTTVIRTGVHGGIMPVS
jgi:hypothetical protein